MSGSIESLRATLRTVDGCCNDHDFILRCKPVDVRAVLQEVERLRAACLAAYRAWVQEAGSSQFVKDEAAHLLIDIVRPVKGRVAEQAGGDE